MKALVLSLAFLLLPTVKAADALDLHRTKPAVNISKFGTEPRWSPKSGLIVFSDTNAPGIWVYDRSSGQTRKIQTQGGCAAWNPEGDKIAFWKANRLWLVNPDGTGALDTGLAVGWSIQWSPDGKHIVAHGETRSSHDSLWLIDTLSWTQRELLFAKFGPRQKVGLFCLTPEGNILFSKPLLAPDWQPNELREYSLRGKLVRTIHLTGIFQQPFGMAVSPDGERLVFDQGKRGIWMANRDGSGVRQILKIGSAADWSPDRKSLVFDDSGSTPDVRNGIFILDLGLDLQ